MFQRVVRTFEKGVDLLEVKARLIMRSLERVGIVWIAYLGAGTLFVCSLGILLAAAVVLLAPVTGTGGALLIAGASTAIIGGAVLYMAHRYSGQGQRARRDIVQRMAEAECEFRDALHGREHPHAPPSETPHDSPTDVKHLIEQAMKNPAAIAGTALALVSLLGIKRTWRLASFGTAVYGIVESMLREHRGAQSYGDEDREAVQSERARRASPNGYRADERKTSTHA